MTNNNADSQPVIAARDLEKVFRDFWRRPKVRAVNGVSLEVNAGEIFGLLGPNGSGKSTTIKMLLGLLTPDSGDIAILGHPPKHVATKERIGYLPEESHLYQHLSPRETLRFYGRLFDIPIPGLTERVEQLLDMVGLLAAANRPVGELSKGMARRVGLAQALINDPELIILDEPTSGLDPIGCRQVKDLLLALAKRGKTILLSSHLLADVEDVCQRVAILYSGRVCAEGGIGELLSLPQRTTLTLRTPAAAELEKILASVSDVTGSKPDTDLARMDLERFFLDVVERADDGTEPVSGAERREGIAPFLQARESDTP